MRVKFILVLALLICANVSAQVAEEGYFNYLKNGFDKHDSDITDFLISEFKNYLNTFPTGKNADESLYMLGNLYFEKKEWERAFITYLKIKFIYPASARLNDVTTQLNQIIHNKAEKTFKENRSVIDEVISSAHSTTNTVEAFSDYLTFLHELNIEEINELLVQEINHYLHAYAKDAKDPDQQLFWLAELYEKFKDWKEAIYTYGKLLYIAPQSALIPKCQFQIAYTQYKETKQYQQAKDMFVQLITDFAEMQIAGDAQFYLAEMYEKKLDNLNEAVSNYRLLVETYPENVNAVASLRRVAEIKEDQDHFEEAIASYYQIHELYPKNFFTPKALLEIERLYRKELKKFEKAIEIAKIYANEYSDQENAAEVLYDAAELYRDELQNKQAAIDIYHEVANKFPNSKYAKKANDKIEDLSVEE